MFPSSAFCLAACAALFLSACSGEPAGNGSAPAAESAPVKAQVLTVPDARDIHSYARPGEARVTHLALDLTADFAAKRIGGTATLDIEAAPNAREIVLDTKGLEIGSVTDGGGKPLAHALGKADPILGAPLTVQLNGARRIAIAYRSAPDAAALQWLTPEQTAGKKHPFLFSQGQAILNRTWIPTQDSPGIRQTWEARVVVPEPLKAVMSAENLTPEGEPAAGGRAFRFRMDKPVAPYLIAIAAGDIAFRALGPRTGVYAEPATLDAAASEFADTEKMVAAAEQLYGPYRWGRYDMIVLPPSFPFGGMENPRLTFLTPTLLAGDKSLVSTVAHELAHSWSGNLVTNATWADFWLNEGFTTYFTSRILEQVYGREAAEREIALGWADLQRTVEESGGAASPKTQLHLDLTGADPDEGMSDIAYEKGAAFLRTVEQAVGRQRFDAWLRSYFDRFAFQPMTASVFLGDLRQHLLKGDPALERKLMLEEWVYRPGIPPNVAQPPAQAFTAVDRAVQQFGGGGPASALPFAQWSTAERIRFLNGLPRQLPRARLDELDRAFRLSDVRNSEVLFAWLKLAIANRYDPAVPALERFLASMGRRKFVAPLFEALAAQDGWGRPIAERIYARTRPLYHSVTSGTVDKTLKQGG
ncbi:MAG TPA: M1 family metallopeptidase [Allosphingosinicella sp.]